jgi:hypothetical protein
VSRLSAYNWIHPRTSAKSAVFPSALHREHSVTESYPPPADRSSPAPPDIRPPKPQRFQFSLAALLLVVLVSALAASALRCAGLPSDWQLVGFTIWGIFLAYLTWRWAAAWRRFDRWNEVQQHRADLADWARQRQKQIKLERASTDSLPSGD